MALTAPQDRPVVTAAQRADSASPKRTSLPSMLPSAGSMPAACSIGLPAASAAVGDRNARHEQDAHHRRPAPSPAGCRRPCGRRRRRAPTGITRIARPGRSSRAPSGSRRDGRSSTLKKPPPLVPSCLIATWLATGPSAMVCSAPSSVVASTEACRSAACPSATSRTRDDDRQRQQDVERRAGHIDPEVADGPAPWRGRSRGPAPRRRPCPSAAERKFCTVSPAIWREVAHGGLAAVGSASSCW